MNEIVIPYTPRPIWKDTIHPALVKNRFAVLVCHRRFGKTVGTVNEMIKKAILNEKKAPVYAYVAPYRNQAKRVAWEYLKYYTNPIPNRTVNESELYIELPSRCRAAPGARLYIIGADHPDALRGIYLDGVILDEYADIKPELWGGVIRPALSDRAGWAVFIGTPKGQNQFYEMYQHAQKSAGWYACIYRADESGVLPTEELADMKAQMTAMEIRQELLCDFTASASDVVIPIDLVTEAGDLVIDFFGGSGSTLVAADMTGRVCYTTELDPKYVDTIIRRYIETSGKQTVTVERGGRELTLAEVMGKDTGGDVDA